MAVRSLNMCQICDGAVTVPVLGHCTNTECSVTASPMQFYCEWTHDRIDVQPDWLSEPHKDVGDSSATRSSLLIMLLY